MENIVLKDLVALLKIYNDKKDDISLFRILNSKLLGIRKIELVDFCKNVYKINKKGQKILHYYDALLRDDLIVGNSKPFFFLHKKFDKLFARLKMDELVDFIFSDFYLDDQSKIFGIYDEVQKVKFDLLDFIKESSFLTVDDCINFVTTHSFFIDEMETVKDRILIDLDYQALCAKFYGNDDKVELWKEKKKKVLDGENSFDILFYNDQIEQNEYIDEKLLRRKPIFSPSQFNSYETCPLMYKYQYVFRIPSLPKYYFTFGSVMHKVIEEITKRLRDNLDVSEAFALLLYENMWESIGYQTKEQEQEYKRKGREIVKTFLETQKSVDTEILDIEKTFTVMYNSYRVFGIIDRIDVDSDGNLIVVDYKTSKTEKNDVDLRNDIQLLTYYDGTNKIRGQTPRLVGHWYLVSNKVVSVIPTLEDLEKIRSRILKICDSVVDEKFNSQDGDHCNYCDFKLLCDKWN